MTEVSNGRTRVVVAGEIDPAGLAPLAARAELIYANGRGPETLAALLGSAEALLVRSETKVAAELMAAGEQLRVVGRAGAGVDNIDVEAATRRGIVVVNAPGGNTFAAAEHTIALLLAAARRIPAADASLKRGEWRRSDFVGVEMRGKGLGLVGLGRVGAEGARRALSFDLRVLAFDPYVSADLARRIGVELADLRAVLSQADFVSLHTPLTDS